MVMPQALRAALGWDTRAGRRSARVDLWRDTDVIRADLFGAERLEHHAISLARAQPVTSRRIRVMPLAARVDANADRLLAAYRACAQTVQARRSITPAAEWLLDNFHLIEQQVQQIRDDLPPGYYRQLPKLAEGPFAGYPRVLGIAWAYVAHGDSLLNPPVLARFVRAYQTVAPLTIGELWAVAITLRIVLIENARRLSDEIMAAHEQRAQADRVVDALLAPCTGDAPPPALRLAQAVAPLEGAPLPEILAARIAKRLRGCDPVRTPLCGWLDDRLAAQDITSDAVILRAQQRQGASNVTMRNIVTSMRLISEMDWQDLFEEVSPVDAQLRAGSDFAALDFATRNLYRTAIETLARGAAIPEAEVAAAALARAADGHDDTTRDPGHWLIGAGTATLERDIGHLPRPGARAMRIVARTGLAGYLGATAVAALAILALAAWVSGAQGWGAVALAVLGLGLALEAGVALVNLAVTRLVAPRRLPGLELADGIPPDLRCLVAVPVLLSSSAEVAEAIARLEVHHLSSTGGALHYALVSDGRDAATETEPQDAGLIAMATAAIARLNAAHPSQDGARFVFLHRRRQWNPSMGVWMGWERKRGKLAELNRLLRGATDTSFVAPATVPGGVRFVITLDADTRLLRDTVRRLIGKMAHPLNRPRLDPALGRVTRGHGILQPRVTPALAVGAEGSVFQRINAGHAGIDAYAAAISDVYQDLFDEGSFTGKGIYDVDAFAGALAGRVPENTMLSHDLFEGIFARAGLVSDIEVVEEFPTRHDVAARRQDRWVRGDWQLLPWLLGRRAMPGLGRWKITDNLRRSLTPPLTLAALATGWLMAPPLAAGWTLAVLGMLALPHLLPLPFVVLPGRAGITARSHVAALGADARAAVVQIVLGITFLPDTAFRMGDAIVRTAVRLAVSRRNLLAWITAAQSAQGARPGLWAQGRRMGWGVALGLGVAGGAVVLNPGVWPLVLPFALLWLASPAIAHRISQPAATRRAVPMTAAEVTGLRLIARATWRYFETFVTAEDNFLPPDNFQETPRPVLARRTSPTNIGMYLLSVTAAHDLGWIGRGDALARLERTLATMQRMPRFRGHLHNWHATDDLRVLEPGYVSSVDSGNLAGHLIAVAQACADWQAAPQARDADWRAGLDDGLRLAGRALAAAPDPGLADLLGRLETALAQGAPLGRLLALAAEAAAHARAACDPAWDVAFWCAALHAGLAGHAADRDTDLRPRLAAAERTARDLATGMDFAFLLDRDKMLLSIGFSLATNRLDHSCYDLLASEARLASLFAIAKGDVETRHWFRLGRAATPLGTGTALVSWSGSMFEYLMPSLVLQEPGGSVLEDTNHRIVARQQAHAGALGIPWGISESAYNARDLEMTYQYSNFGVPGLGLKRGLGSDRVIAPYATALAAMVAPAAALRNLARLADLGAEGRYGFHEAVDFTPARLPAGADRAVVRSFMAHHQGMTIAAIANCVQDGRLRARFHAEPMIRAVELLLQERVPRDATDAPPRAREVRVTDPEPDTEAAVRRFPAPAEAMPTAHLLSNGTYGVVLTPGGAGFSRWRDLAVTRWRGDPTSAAQGAFILMRDRASGRRWSAGVQPTGADPARHSAVFSEHHAAFTHRGDGLTTVTEVVVSAEDDAEARRVTLTNTAGRAREIELTSCAELVLAPAAADAAHPAFSKLFVVTDFLPELGVVIATRRRRSAADPEVWAAHIAVVEGTEAAPLQFETDRARFIGAGGSMGRADMATAPLSQTTGTVLDPMLAIRRSVVVPAGGMARVTFWTMVADDPGVLLDLVDRHRDPSAFGRAVTLAWTQAQVQLRHLDVAPAAAADFQRLGGMLLRGDSRLRTSAAGILRGAGPQSALWPMGISGDLPLIVFRIQDTEDTPGLLELLAAHEYLRMHQLAVDVVILNDRATSYVQDLQTTIETAVRSARSRPRPQAPEGLADGTVHVLRSDIIGPDARALVLAVAGVVLVAGRGRIGQQIDAAVTATAPRTRAPDRPVPAPPPSQAPRPTAHQTQARTLTRTLARNPTRIPTRRPSQAQAGAAPASAPEAVRTSTPDFDTSVLEFFNGLGGFARDGREYVTVLHDGQTTPAPWINVIANPGFGFQTSALGAGHVWAINSRENQITPWSNDPVTDPAGEALFLHDLDTGATWTPTARPIRDHGLYVARHGFGYSSFEHAAHGIEARMVQFVPLEDPIRITRLTLRNTSGRPRRLSVTAYVEWVLGASRATTLRHVITEIDPGTGAILARNPASVAFSGRVAFADLGADTTSHSGDRAEILGIDGTMAAPVGITDAPLSGRTGPALDPCAALRRVVTLPPGTQVEVLFLLGQAESAGAAQALILRHRAADPAATLAAVTAHWADLLGGVQVTSPDRAMDIMLNGWLLYQTLACRIWARAGFYQASGAYGFRDQLQDGMALAALRPALTRAHLLRAAARQFPEGDVQHWWLPHSGQGVRTRISDDRVWLGHAVAQYVAVSGDSEVLDAEVPFLDGPALRAGVHDDFFLPTVSDDSATLFEHCARGLDQAIAQTGENGMPLIGTGDWNDGMNRVGADGRGTSVWLGWLLIATLHAMAPLAQARDPARATRWRAHAEAVRRAIERHGWDGAWYRRGTYDDGTPLGSATSTECRIDSIAQSWAVLSGAADPARAATAMASMTAQLIRRDPGRGPGLALLFAPPFDASPQDPGYIKGYPPGLRENGGQYTHAAMWSVLAHARMGDGCAAGRLFAMLNPINHARTPADTARYKVEPYVAAADVYATAPHVGRGGWTWYTGSAAWMYRAGIEGLLGLTRAGAALHVAPCFPRDWPRVSATVRIGATRLEITVHNPDRTGRGIAGATLDGMPLAPQDGRLRVGLTGGSHRLSVTLGATVAPAQS